MRSIHNCPVAVVGGAGFLGSHLVDHLIEDRACKVLVIDNLIAGRREFVHPQAEFVHHDITGSEAHLTRLFCDSQIQFVFNYAAMPYVPDSYDRPLRVFDVNAMGALKVINAAQEAGCEAVLQVSSAELYGDPGYDNQTYSETKRITEDCVVRPHSSYGAAKAAIDALVQVRWREAKTPVIALRQFNCVGERETHPYVIPEIISQLAVQQSRESAKGATLYHGIGKTAVVRLGNNSSRDFLYAGDQARIAVELLERGQFGEVYNLGSERSIKIYDLAKLIGERMGFATVQVEPDPARMRKWEIWHLQSDNTKLQEATNYQRNIIVPLEEALGRTIAYYEANGRCWPWEKVRGNLSATGA